MSTYDAQLIAIKSLLKSHPHGLTITDISEHIGINRNSVAKYLDVLTMTGQVEQRSVGPAKLFSLSHRVPANALLQHAHEAILLFDDERIIQANDKAAELLATPRERLIGSPARAVTFIHDDERARALAGTTQHVERVCAERTVAATLLPIMFDDGTVGAAVIAQDVTRQRAAESRQRLLERAVEASSSGIAIADARAEDTPLIYVNPAFERITGYPSAEVLGKNCRFLQGTARDQPALDVVRRALREGTACTVELKNFRKDGTLFWNELRLAPVRNDTGEVTHFVGIQTDITHTKTPRR